MTVSYHKGDVFEQLKPNTILVHGCNARHVMGAGIALQVKRRFPEAYHDYMATPILKLGMVIFTQVAPNTYIANAITQEGVGTDRAHATTSAIWSCLTKVKEFNEFYKVIMPEIGCGLGGLKTDDVFPVIEKVFCDHQKCEVYSL